MSEKENNEKKSFIGYEYKEVTVNRKIESVYTDCYSSFGWKLENSATPFGKFDSVTLKFKRNRKINRKSEIAKLQRQFESCVEDIQALEFSKVIGASTVSYIIGVAGTALMAGSVFAYLASMLPLSIILAIPAFIGWIVPYVSFKKIKRNKIAKVNPLIDQKYDEIYEVCERASELFS